MQYVTTINDESVPGITAAMTVYNASLPAMVKNEAGDDTPNPAIVPHESAYIDFVLKRAIESWNRQHATTAPPAPSPDVSVNGIPQFVKKWQLMAGLRKDGMYTGVMAYINSLPPASLDLWNGSQGIERTSPFIPAFKARFNLTDAVVDGMFQRYAAMTQADVLALE